MNAEITYCYNYWQMYKNPSEIVAHKKRLRSKVVALKKNSLKVTAFSCRKQFFFQVTLSFYFTKVAAAIHSSMERVFLKRALTAITCVYTMYLTRIWKVLSKFAIPTAVTHLMNDPFSIIKEQLQPRILLNLLFLHNKSCSKEIS